MTFIDDGNEQSELLSPALILSKIGCNNAKVSEAKREKFLNFLILNLNIFRYFKNTQKSRYIMRKIPHSVIRNREILEIQLTFAGLADEMDGRGVKACIVWETPAASTNSSRNSVLVLPRALKIQK